MVRGGDDGGAGGGWVWSVELPEGGLRFAPAERMNRERLDAARADVERLAGLRREIPARGRLRDYRAIFHAHAEDSTHTGGTREEMLEAAARTGVSAIFLSDHFRPPRDFMGHGWRGVREGVLFVPGSEARGFLIHPAESVMDRMDAPTGEFLGAVRANGGLAFLSHVEERPDHPAEDLDGLEIVNRHFEAKEDRAGLLSLLLRMTDPAGAEELRRSAEERGDELFASQQLYPSAYLRKWDEETRRRRLTGIAANDCHHNNVLILKKVDETTALVGTNVDSDEAMRRVTTTLRPGLRELLRGRAAGEVVARADLDPYDVAFRNVSTHVLADRLDEGAFREAIRGGRAYVAHDWMGDPTGFRFEAFRGDAGEPSGSMGDELAWPVEGGWRLRVEATLPGLIRVLEGGRVVAEGRGRSLDFEPEGPGAHRVECWLELGGEWRPWIYSNPIYLRESGSGDGDGDGDGAPDRAS